MSVLFRGFLRPEGRSPAVRAPRWGRDWNPQGCEPRPPTPIRTARRAQGALWPRGLTVSNPAPTSRGPGGASRGRIPSAGLRAHGSRGLGPGTPRTHVPAAHPQGPDGAARDAEPRHPDTRDAPPGKAGSRGSAPRRTFDVRQQRRVQLAGLGQRPLQGREGRLIHGAFAAGRPGAHGSRPSAASPGPAPAQLLGLWVPAAPGRRAGWRVGPAPGGPAPPGGSATGSPPSARPQRSPRPSPARPPGGAPGGRSASGQRFPPRGAKAEWQPGRPEASAPTNLPPRCGSSGPDRPPDAGLTAVWPRTAHITPPSLRYLSDNRNLAMPLHRLAGGW